MVGYEDPTFFIKGGDGGFADRQKNIFDKLTVAEKERNDRQQEADVQSLSILPCDNKVRSRKRCRSQMKQFRGKESIFKRPDVPPPRFKNKGVPDYHRNPHKWVKYSLADVSQEDMSDRSNTAAAISFLKEIQERKGQEEMEVDSTPSEITFRQPKSKTKLISQHDSSVSIISGNICGKNTTHEDAKSSFRSSKLIMPEYIVGVTKKKDKKKHEKPHHQSQNEGAMSQIKLQHLMEEDDNE